MERLMKHTILVVDDDHKTVDLIRAALEHAGFAVTVAYDGIEALATIRRESSDLIILDWMLPQVSGLDLCRIICSESAIPVIMLTAKATEDDKLLGLNLGVDDYLTKPFSLRELVARVHTILRRTYKSEALPATLQVGNLRINLAAHEVTIGDSLVYLTPKEFKLLEMLARFPGRTFRRQELVERVCGPDFDGFDRTIDFHLSNLRRKLEASRRSSDAPSIQTVYGIGYKLAVS
jgi:DNA-binding response OmpR family regulator